MTTDQGRFTEYLRRLCDLGDQAQHLPLDTLLTGIPRLSALEILPGQAVIVRADLDVPLDGERVLDPTRLKSCVQTLRHCIDAGAKVVLIGHLGRTPSASLKPVAEALTELLGANVLFVSDWFDEQEWRISPLVSEQLSNSPAGTVLLFENLRRYGFERALWDASPQSAVQQSERLFDLVQQFARLSGVLINDAIAASNRDFSSAVLPFGMTRSALGYHIAAELADFAAKVVLANCLIFSGLKANKLDDLEGIVDQGYVRDLIVGGALAMALVKAEGERHGISVSIGLAETDPKYIAYVDPDRVAQARRILEKCSKVGATVHLPIDYILDDGVASSTIPPDRAQLDIGPATAKAYSDVISGVANGGHYGAKPPIVFLNGVMGKVEDDRFTGGTLAVFEAIAAATSDGAETYVGGGDGRAALAKFGYAERVTHAFTAGGTILKLMSGRAIPYLLSMYLSNQSDGKA